MPSGRWLAVMIACSSCADPPPVNAPVEVPALPATSVAIPALSPSVAPTAPPAATVAPAPTATAAPEAPPAPPKPHPPPPKPPMSIAWSFHLLRMGPHPSTSTRLEVDESGEGVYQHDSGHDDPVLGRGVECRRHVAPDLHKKLVEAGRAVVISGGCSKQPGRRGMPNISIHGTYAGREFGCEVDREARSYQAFHAVREQVEKALCQ